MNKFRHRSDQKELLDEDHIPFEAIKRNMEELNFINTYTGGHAITLKGVSAFISNEKKLRVCEIGCGGGDNLKAIHNYFSKRNIDVELTGIDINEACIEFAKSENNYGIRYITSDYRDVKFDVIPDVIFSSLFCHHFNDKQLEEMMQWMKKNSNQGFFINDLHRHPVAYYFIKFVTRLFSKSYLVKNDAPLSVLRGFVKEEWKKIMDNASIRLYSIRWQWAFRYLIICKNGQD